MEGDSEEELRRSVSKGKGRATPVAEVDSRRRRRSHSTPLEPMLPPTSTFPPPEPIPPDGPDPPLGEGDSTHVPGGSFSSTAFDDLPVPAEMVHDYGQQESSQLGSQLPPSPGTPKAPASMASFATPDTHPPSSAPDPLAGLAATPSAPGDSSPALPSQASLLGLPSHGPPSLQLSVPVPSSSPDALDLLAASNNVYNQPAVEPVPNASQPSIYSNAQDLVVDDPALLRFRSARTFRTRTALQLQPYTKEKQLYESVLRRGGLSKGRRGVAPASQVRAASDDENVDDSASLGAESSSDDDHVPPEAIVIGDTPPTRPPRQPKQLIDDDFDEFYDKFGKTAIEEDELDQKRLQAIARIRLRAEREEKKQERAAERNRRAFAAFMRQEERERKAKALEEKKRQREVEEKGREERKSAGSTTGQKQGIPAQAMKPRTYGRRRGNVDANDAESPLASPPRSPVSAETHLNLLLQSSPRLSSSPHAFEMPLPGFQEPDDNFESAFDDIVDVATPIPSRSNTRTPASTRRKRVIESSSQSSSDSESDNDAHSTPPGDKRRRIAERMLPRAMLKRLESEAKQKQQAREARRRAAVRSESPVRRGHAVVRRVSVRQQDEMTDFFNNEASDDSVQEIHALEAEEGSDGSDSGGSLGRPVMTSDSSGSEALEDNRRNDGLARLQDGDFEGIVHGRPQRRPAEPRQRRDRDRQPSRKRERRPALGLVKTVRAQPAQTQRLMQSRIDFPVIDTPPRRHAPKSKSSRHRSRPSNGSLSRSARKRRPAIRLDDRIIFANDDFDFPSASEAEVAPRPPAKRSAATVHLRGDGHLARRNASPTPTATPHTASRQQVDEGIGKARSWANFDKFPIDFDITPLPSGVFCADIEGADLDGVLAAFAGATMDEPKLVTAYGVTLHSGILANELLAVMPIIVEGVYDSIRTFVDSGTHKPNLAPLTFLRNYLARADAETRTLVAPLVRVLGERLDTIALSGVKHERQLIEQVLLARYALLEISATVNDGVVAAAADLINLLLTYGFDRTVRSLRRIIRGQAETPQVDNISVALWVAAMHILKVHNPEEDQFAVTLSRVLDTRYSTEVGPMAAERIWFLIFGLCALSQFGPDATVSAEYAPHPRWALVKRALGLIKVAHSQEAEESARHDQLQGRDRYIKTMVARCLRLSSTWQWSFDRTSFSVATRDLGMIFKERQHRNLPTEPPADFPRFISKFDISLTASEETRGSAFELWLRLVSVAASDLIGSAEELAEAQSAERDVQRLIMSIFPLSAVPFTREKPPTATQLAALVNRYSTMVVACYFSPSLLPWLLANSQKWLAFERADFNSRQICIRGLMYLAVACRHHGHPLDAVVARLAEILAKLQGELEDLSRPPKSQAMPTRVEIERTMVLVVSCFRQIILHPGYAPRPEPVYPDPSLLHECTVAIVTLTPAWTGRVFRLDLAKDVKSGLEIVATIQAFLDARSAALPKRARRALETRQKESLDDYPSLGFDFDTVDLAALGGDEAPTDPAEVQDEAFAKVSLGAQ